MTDVVVLGAGAFCRIVRDVGRLRGWNIYACAEAADEDALLARHEGPVVLAVGDNFRRWLLAEKIAGRTCPHVLHPSAVIADGAVLQEGAVVLAGAVIEPGAAMGPFANLWTRAVLGHDCTLGACVSISAGTIVGAGVVIGARAFLGMNCVVMPGVTIGPDCVVGACALVTRDLPANSVAVGSPARVIRQRATGEPYLTKPVPQEKAA